MDPDMLLAEIDAASWTARDWETPVDGHLRIAVVGLGWFGRDIAVPAIEESTHARLAVVVSGDGEKAGRVAEERGLAAGLTYEAFRDREAAEAYDAVYVATPNARHLDDARAAAALGKHVLVEKPMEATLDRARALRDACDEAGVRLMVAYRMQADPTTRRVRDLIRSGAIGRPVHADGALTGRFGVRSPDGWRFDPDLAGGGALMDVGIYPLNTTRFLLDAAPVAVSATSDRQHAPEGIEEHLAFHLDCDRAPPEDAAIDAGPAVLHGRTSYDAEPQETLTVVGTEGRIHLPAAYNVTKDRTLRLTRDGVTVAVEDIAVNELVEAFDYFAHGVLTETPFEPDGGHGLRDAACMAAIYEAADTGTRVPIGADPG